MAKELHDSGFLERKIGQIILAIFTTNKGRFIHYGALWVIVVSLMGGYFNAIRDLPRLHRNALTKRKLVLILQVCKNRKINLEDLTSADIDCIFKQLDLYDTTEGDDL